MNVESLYVVNEWIILFPYLILMLAASEVGFRLGRHAASGATDQLKAQTSVVEGSLLGVLALLMGFTMSMAVSRFELRKQLVLQEANAIGTAYLRTQLLPTPENTEMANLLREYVDARVEFVNAGENADRLKAARANAARLQDEFWSRAVAYSQKDPSPVKAGLLLQALNEVIDLESARWMGFYNHVPETVIFVNAIVAFLATIMVGYAYGLEGRRQVFSMCLLAVAITVVLSVIVDLDRPRQGFIRTGQQPMIDLQNQLRLAKP
jgi:hypothetical protein